MISRIWLKSRAPTQILWCLAAMALGMLCAQQTFAYLAESNSEIVDPSEDSESSNEEESQVFDRAIESQLCRREIVGKSTTIYATKIATSHPTRHSFTRVSRSEHALRNGLGTALRI